MIGLEFAYVSPELCSRPVDDLDKEPVDRLLREWRSVRPELDFGPMGLFARSNRFVALGMRKLEAVLAEHGLSVGEFDVLSALRRATEPSSLKPSDLADRLMVTRGGITARVDRLETGGLVARHRDPNDRRSEPIMLTETGRRTVDRALVSVLAVETELFGELTLADRKNLDRLLRRLMSASTK
jgi:DNA-binding MarR family transcriptional regulator